MRGVHLPCLSALHVARCVQLYLILLVSLMDISFCPLERFKASSPHVSVLPTNAHLAKYMDSCNGGVKGRSGSAHVMSCNSANGGSSNKSTTGVDVYSRDATENNHPLSLVVSEVKEMHSIVGNGMQTTECTWRWAESAWRHPMVWLLQSSWGHFTLSLPYCYFYSILDNVTQNGN